MKINPITSLPVFKGVREDRNTVAQLKENNNYSLTVPNQRRISKAIENLAKQRGEENVRFLLDVAENLKYQGHVPNKELPSQNAWAAKLKGATEASLAHSNPILREKYQPEIDRVFSAKPLTEDEKTINTYKTRILSSVKKYEKADEINKNLDYFITSSETPIEQKKYIMKRLDYFMSPKYEINPQLKDKKAQVLHEISNDIVINTPESKIPNIKAINQKTHGMCAAISIARKCVAYEDKPNYVDAILSELDSSDTVKVYDRQHLGSGKRVPVKKIPVDFDYAQQRGYRIVDASTLQWMNIAGMYGSQNENTHIFSAFNKDNFDAFHDAFFTQRMKDKDLATKQANFQVLTKAKSDIGATKSKIIRKDIESSKARQSYHQNLKALNSNNNDLRNYITQIIPSANKETRNSAMKDLGMLLQPVSSKIEKLPENVKKYAFIPNEETSQKQKKIEQYFVEQYGKQNIDQDALSKKAVLIIDTLEDISSLDKEVNANTSQAAKIAHARSLYEAEAIYRASIITGLNDRDIRTDNLVHYNIPDNETRIIDGFDKVIEKIEKNNDKTLMGHFAPMFDTTADNKKEIVNCLKEVKHSVEYLTTNGLDSLYAALGYGNRADVLVSDMKNCRESIEKGDKDELKRTATCFHIKEDKSTVLKNLTTLTEKLEKNPMDQKTYTEAFNKMGYKGQAEAFADVYESATDILLNNDSIERAVFINNFKAVNGLGEKATDAEVVQRFSEIGENFNSISHTLSVAKAMLDVKKEDGTPYFTVSEHGIITKKMENEGKLVPVQTMIKLQDRFAKIDKIRSSDEFASRQGKISDPTLYKLSNEEKQGVKQIEKNLNFMYSDVVKRLTSQYREIRKPLEEMARQIGTTEGNYWVSADGQSGLYKAQQAKIFEQLTDRPHYETEDVQEGARIIKNGAHSGISSSSVFHDRVGGHAQYVADIVADDKTGRDILFHDNTWGASEHENTWVDSEGHTRTDYSDRRGGELGYITDDNWRNGNYVDNLVYKKGTVAGENVESKTYKRINPSSREGYDFSLMSGLLIEGKSPVYKDVAATIKDEIFIPDSAQIKNIEKYAKSMTKLQIQKAIFKNKTVGQAYKKQYNKIMDRIKPTPFNKGIRTEADYNALADNDPIKVAFEKAAIRANFADGSMYKELAGKKSVKELAKIRDKQRKMAYKDFEYSFYKGNLSGNILNNGVINNDVELSTALLQPLKKNNIKYDVKNLKEIIKCAVDLDEKDEKSYNGSLKNSLDIIKKRVSDKYDEVMPATEECKQAKAEFMTNLNNFYDKNVYFNKEDLKADTPKTRAIRQWIDDKFDPKSDEEFVNIYRNLQDMTNDEFAKLTKGIKPEYLGMNNTKGYDILRKVLAANDNAEQDLRNVLFYDEYSKDIDMSKTQTRYKNKKLERNVRGAIYTGARTFDDLYRTMTMDLDQLEYQKTFDKYKDRNYRLYGALPAYPKIDLGQENIHREKLQTTVDLVGETFETLNRQKNYIYDINLAHMLDNYRNSIPANRNLTEIEAKTIKTMAANFADANATEQDIDAAMDAAQAIIAYDKAGTINDYNKHIDAIVGTVKEIEAVNTLEDFVNSNKANAKALDRYVNTLVDANVPTKHRKAVKNALNDWIAIEHASRKNANGLDKNKEVLSLQEKIMQHSTSGNDKELLEGFVEIIDAVNNAKASNPNKSKEMTNLQLTELNKLAYKYADKFISDGAKNGIRANMNDWFRKELVGGKQRPVRIEDVDAAREKFTEEYQKHHITSHPSEILDEFLLASAKDADPNKNMGTYKQYLGIELDLAKYVAVQSALMEAVQAGNAGHVKDYFDEYVVDPYNNGDAVSMNSDYAIDYMVRSMLLSKNTDTAKMFVEKLSLGERVIDIELKTVKELNVRKRIDKVVKELINSSKTTQTVKDEYSKLLDSIDGAKDVDLEITKAKRQLAKLLKNNPDKAAVKFYLEALENGRESIKKRPDISRYALMSTEMDRAMEKANDAVNDRVKEEQSYVEVANDLCNFMLDIHFEPNSNGKKLQDKVRKEQQAINDYNNNAFTKLANENSGVSMVMKNV